MIKLLISGLWVCVVTLLSSYVAVSWQSGHTTPLAPQKASATTDAIKTRMISVPVIVDGALQGYVMAQFIFTVDAKLAGRLPIKPDIYILDETFKTMYSEEKVDFRHFRKQDLPKLSKRIVESVNARIGSRLVEDVLIQELTYVSKDQARSAPRH
ncbi:MAG: hypothetical protein F9K29_09600 [Hyphomicrobiaceae bacterium]|nr:MAG: hypothetical protein F9K29_09600 [Hyphomicrobiaceae bacterium]